MNRNVESLLLAAIVLALLASACGPQAQGAMDGSGAQQAEPSSGVGGGPESPTSAPAKGAGNLDEAAAEESSQADQAAAGPEEEVSREDPEGIPSEEERKGLLDQVNLGGPIPAGGDERVGGGPAPGTDSDQGKVRDIGSVGEDSGHDQGGIDASGSEQGAAGPEEEVSGTAPGNIPSEEERNALLDSVNQGGPAPRGGAEDTGDGPPPGTESD